MFNVCPFTHCLESTIYKPNDTLYYVSNGKLNLFT